MNVKLKYYLLWILTCVVLWILVVIAWFILYEKWYFDDNGSWRIVIDREDQEQYQPNVDLSLVTNEEKKIEQSKKDDKKLVDNQWNTQNKELDAIELVNSFKREHLTNTWSMTNIWSTITNQNNDTNTVNNNTNTIVDTNNVDNNVVDEHTNTNVVHNEHNQIWNTFTKEQLKEIKNEQVFIDLYDDLWWTVSEENKKALSFLMSYYLLSNLQFDPWKFELYYSNIDVQKKTINFHKFYEQVQTIDSLSDDELYEIKRKLSLRKKEVLEYIKQKYTVNWKVLIDTCFYKFCSEKKEEYNYIKKAIIHDKEYLDILWKIKKDEWLDPKIFLTIITIENLRMHSQFKWRFKSVFVKYRTPLLANMSQMSYWMYWTKANFVHTLINTNFWNNWNSIFSIWDDPTLKKIKDTYFTYNTETKRYEYINTDTFVDWLIKDKTMQSWIIASFMKMARKWRLTQNVDLFKIQNLRYLLTLYNIWKLWEPKTNPESWWAILDFLTTKYYFWDLANIVFNSLEMLDIEQQISK